MSEPSVKRARGKTRLSLLDKYQIITELEGPNSRSKVAIATGKGVKHQTITYIWYQRESIKEKYKANTSTAKESKSSKRPEKFKDIDELLLTWFQKNRAASKIIDGHALMTEARRAAMRIGTNPEEVTESWVQRWRCRHSIKPIGLYGEAADCANYSD